jgi:hypothetical protein
MKKLKNHILAFLLLLLPMAVQAQESPAQQWIRTFGGRPGITTVSISRTMFKMLSKVKTNDPDYQTIAHFASRLQDFKIMIIDEDTKTDNAKAKVEFAQMVHKLSAGNYEDLMTVNEGGNHIAFRILERNDRIQELVMTITGSENIVMLIKGDFTLEELTDISENMNISGMNKIKKLKK